MLPKSRNKHKEWIKKSVCRCGESRYTHPIEIGEIKINDTSTPIFMSLCLLCGASVYAIDLGCVSEE